MDIHFNDTRPANASAATLFEVITDYARYPSFNKAVTNIRVVRKDDAGAEFVADRTTKIGKSVRAYDRYDRHGDLVVERTYEGNSSARSTWTIHAVDANHSTLTIDALQTMGPVRGVIMKPALKHLFYGINFTPFIEEAERREKAVAAQGHVRANSAARAAAESLRGLESEMKIDFDDTKLDKASAKELKAGLAEAQAGLGG